MTVQRQRLSMWLLVGAALALSGCKATPPQSPPQVTIWRSLGSWKGQGNLQTESIATDSGTLRVRWNTKPAGEVDGTFELFAHSAISGRPLKLAVEQAGLGHGVAYMADDPRVFYMLVESTGQEWSFTVEEALSGSATGNPQTTY